MKNRNSDTAAEAAAMLGKGLKAMFHSVPKLILMAVALYGSYCLWVNSDAITERFSLPVYLTRIAALAIPVLLLFLYGASGSKGIEGQLEDIKFMSSQGVVPKLIKTEKIKKENGTVTKYEFLSVGISIKEWMNREMELETALNCNIIGMEQCKGSKNRVAMYCMSAELALEDMFPWDDNIISDKDFELVAGEGLTQKIRFNLNDFPHALVGGETGSGKSVCLRCLLWQCVKKGAHLYIVDFKGGVEFDSAWESVVKGVVTERGAAIEMLEMVCEEMDRRLALFRQEGVKKIGQYNKKHPESPMARIVIGCDEVAEMLDKEGAEKEEKAEIGRVEYFMSKIARLGRAPGINMILATQRPDAKVIKGQIKNNTPIRMSGRFADAAASGIVINSDAAVYLPETKGRMLYVLAGKPLEFQAYFFDDEKNMTIKDWKKGRMLVDEPNGKPVNEAMFDENLISDEEMEEWAGNLEEV